MGTKSKADFPSPNSAFAHISYPPLYVTLSSVLYPVQAPTSPQKKKTKCNALFLKLWAMNRCLRSK
jgi:hypothetical protein